MQSFECCVNYLFISGHEAIVRLLLEKGAATDVRMGVPATKTPMDIAQDFEHENIVLLLTKYRK